MTGPGKVSVSLLKETTPDKVAYLPLSEILAAVNDAVTRLSTAARTHEHDRPDVAAHLHELVQQIAGVTLDALLTWPRASG
jgi:hypothetical protein